MRKVIVFTLALLFTSCGADDTKNPIDKIFPERFSSLDQFGDFFLGQGCTSLMYGAIIFVGCPDEETGTINRSEYIVIIKNYEEQHE